MFLYYGINILCLHSFTLNFIFIIYIEVFLIINLRNLYKKLHSVSPYLLHAAFMQLFDFMAIKSLLELQFCQFQACSGPKHALEDVSIEFQGLYPTTALLVGAIWQEVSILRYPQNRLFLPFFASTLYHCFNENQPAHF